MPDRDPDAIKQDIDRARDQLAITVDTLAERANPRRIADDMGGIATSIVDGVVAERPDDFVASVAAQLPFRVICDMMGIPDEERPAILERVERSSGHTGGFRLPGQTLRAMARLQHTIGRIGREIAAEP